MCNREIDYAAGLIDQWQAQYSGYHNKYQRRSATLVCADNRPLAAPKAALAANAEFPPIASWPRQCQVPFALYAQPAIAGNDEGSVMSSRHAPFGLEYMMADTCLTIGQI